MVTFETLAKGGQQLHAPWHHHRCPPFRPSAPVARRRRRHCARFDCSEGVPPPGGAVRHLVSCADWFRDRPRRDPPRDAEPSHSWSRELRELTSYSYFRARGIPIIEEGFSRTLKDAFERKKLLTKLAGVLYSPYYTTIIKRMMMMYNSCTKLTLMPYPTTPVLDKTCTAMVKFNPNEALKRLQAGPVHCEVCD